jgi:alpha-1,6-mannosyltransferase
VLPKTLHITNAYHPTSGGISTFYHALIRYANEHGREFRLVVPGERTATEERGPHSRIYFIRAEPSKIGDSRYRVLWATGRTGKEIRDVLRVEQPDLVEISDKYTLPALGGFLRRRWVRGVRRPVLIGTSHERMDDTVRAYLRLGPVGALLSRGYMKRFYFPMFDWHIANSTYTAEELAPASRGHRLPREYRVLPMGVDSAGLDPSNRNEKSRRWLASRAGASSDSVMLLYAGRLAVEKNLPLLVDVLEHLSANYILIIAGDGEMREWLEKQSKSRASGRIRFVGHIKERSELAKLYGGADVFVHPNAREPFGIAPLEAMASGLPVVVPSSGGVLSYANDQNAWLSPVLPQNFASAVQEAAAAGKDHPKLKRARASALELAWPRVAERFFRFYDETVAAGRVRSFRFYTDRVPPGIDGVTEDRWLTFR